MNSEREIMWRRPAKAHFKVLPWTSRVTNEDHGETCQGGVWLDRHSKRAPPTHTPEASGLLNSLSKKCHCWAWHHYVCVCRLQATECLCTWGADLSLAVTETKAQALRSSNLDVSINTLFLCLAACETEKPKALYRLLYHYLSKSKWRTNRHYGRPVLFTALLKLRTAGVINEKRNRLLNTKAKLTHRYMPCVVMRNLSR